MNIAKALNICNKIKALRLFVRLNFDMMINMGIKVTCTGIIIAVRYRVNTPACPLKGILVSAKAAMEAQSNWAVVQMTAR
jgi:hypothetical protein